MQSNIDSFFIAVEQQISKAETLEDDLHRRIILCTIIEALAKYAFPEIRGNGRRFKDFIDKYSMCRLTEKVSLGLLKLKVVSCINNEDASAEQLVNIDEADILLRDIECKLSNFIYLRKACEIEPSISELPNCSDKRLRKLIKETNFSSQMWGMRNSIIHEFKPPDNSSCISKKINCPYYHGFCGIETKVLYIPTEFIANIARCCAHSLKQSFISENIDPYERPHSDTGWYD